LTFSRVSFTFLKQKLSEGLFVPGNGKMPCDRVHGGDKKTMPIFEFKCSKCGEIYDVLFRNREEKIAVACPKCGSKKANRLLSAFAGKIGNTSAGGAECGSCAATSCGPS
jgi:putative FmdB family regulatory protein